VGIEYQPHAKFLSVVVTFFVVCIYDYLTSMVSKTSLFHIVALLYGIQFMVIAGFLSDPHKGLDNTNKNINRLIGWLSYFAIECYGSLMVALFWSFTNSVMNLEQAKGAYGLIIAIAQIGAMGGSTLATKSENVGGIPQLFLIGSLLVFSISLLIKVYQIVYHNKLHNNNIISTTMNSNDINTTTTTDNNNLHQQSKIKIFFSSFFDGLYIILQHRYVLFILGISCLHEIVLTILDYEFKIIGSESIISHTTTASDSLDTLKHLDITYSTDFANLLGQFG
jgi:AAA family ATP:ADP antiporter